MRLVPRSLRALQERQRDRVSPDDLNVAPALLGAPLAPHRRRLAAIAIDAAVVGAISSIGNLALLAGAGLIAATWLRDREAALPRRRRMAAGAVALLLLALGALQAWQERDAPRRRDTQFTIDAADAAEAAEAAASVAAAVGATAGIEEPALAQVREALRTAAGAAASAAAPAASAPAAAESASGAPPATSPSSASHASPASGAAGIAATAQALRIAALERELARARRAHSFDPREQFAQWAEDVGLGLGWAIVYFTLLPAWWNGQTPGKRLLGLRIVELTGKPITVMRAFKRYGGYAAGLSTGGLGFVQVLWDSNRQAIQDKTAHTVVIDLRRARVPPP